ncbi:MAG: hypothetical protein ACSHX8_04645 [Opitutaceae bacterium]
MNPPSNLTFPVLSLFVSTLLFVSGCQSTSQPSTESSVATPTAKTVLSKPAPIVAKQVVVETPKEPRVVSAFAINFKGMNPLGSDACQLSDFQTEESRLPADTPVNHVTHRQLKDKALGVFGDSKIRISATDVGNSYDTDKGKWLEDPILNGYLYVRGTSSFTISNLNMIPIGAEITLTLWGVGDTPGSGSKFNVVYNGSTVGELTTAYEGAKSGTVAKLSFKKVASVDEFEINWTKNGKDIPGFNGMALVATVLE